MATTHVGPRPFTAVPRTKIQPIFPAIKETDRVHQIAAMTDRRPGAVAPTRWPHERPALQGPTAASGLVVEATAIAFQTLELLEEHAREVAADFRASDVVAAQRGLRNLVHSTRTLLRLAAMSAHAAGTNVRALCHAVGSTADRQAQNALDHLTALLIARDWSGMAALLELEFSSTLAEWRTIFEVLADSCFEPDPGGLSA